MRRLQALIWDVDGTLAETERDGHRVAWNLAFEALGVPWRWSVARYGELLLITGGKERLLHDLASQPQAPRAKADQEALVARLHDLKNRHYAGIVAAGHIPLRPGVAALMADCRLADLPMAIATTTSRGNVNALMEAHFGPGWASGFAAVLCAEEAPLKKPDPQVYLMTLARLGLAADEVLAIEDSGPGLGAGCAAGLPVVVARSVYFEQLTAQGALAAGPGLNDRAGWTGPVNEPPSDPPGPAGERVDLELLSRWHAAQRQASAQRLGR